MMTSSVDVVLADICEAIVDCEHKTAPTQDSGIPLIRTTDVQNGKLNLNSAKKVSESTYKEWSRRMELKAEDIILAREAPVGEVGYVPKGERVCLGQRTVLIRINSKVAYSRYILYLLCTAPMRYKMASLAAGSVVPHLNMEDIRALTLPELPSLEQQKTIADILGSIDDKIELNQQMNKTLEGIGQAVFKRWFVDFEFPNEEGKPYKSSGGEMIYDEYFGKTIPACWELRKIGDVLTTVLGGTPDRTNPEYWGGDVPWINSGKINEFRIIEPTEYITEKGLENSATKLLPKRTTVLAITGATLGQVSLLEIDSCANQSVIGVLESKEIPSEYIYFWIKQSILNIIAWQTGGAQQHINKQNVNDSPLLIPSAGLLSANLNIIRPLFDKIVLNCFENSNLGKMRDLLLPKLMSGKIRVSVTKENAKCNDV